MLHFVWKDSFFILSHETTTKILKFQIHKFWSD